MEAVRPQRDPPKARARRERKHMRACAHPTKLRLAADPYLSPDQWAQTLQGCQRREDSGEANSEPRENLGFASNCRVQTTPATMMGVTAIPNQGLQLLQHGDGTWKLQQDHRGTPYTTTTTTTRAPAPPPQGWEGDRETK